MKPALCVLVFLALTFETESYFAEGKFHTFMVYAELVFQGQPLTYWDTSVGLIGLLAILRRGSFRYQVGPLNLAVAASAAALAALVAWGAIMGGDLRMSYFQLAAVLRMLLLFPVARAVFRTRRDLAWLALTVAAAAVFQAAICIQAHRFFLANVGIIEWPEYMTEHHDSVLWSVVLVGLSFGLVAGLRAVTLVPIGLALPLLLLAVYYNDRRLAWLEIMGGLALGYLVLPKGRRSRRLNRLALVSAPVLALYLAVGWGRSGAVFAPVRQIQSMLVAKGDASNTYRDLENMGLIVTLQSTRLLGTGLGHEFREVTDMYVGMAGWEEYRFFPHNSVLGLVSSGGVLGFPLVWAFLPVGAFFAARAALLARRPIDHVLATAAFAYPFIYGVQAFGDMGIQSLKANVLLACSLAISSRLAVLTGAWPVRRGRPRPALTPSEPRVGMTHG